MEFRILTVFAKLCRADFYSIFVFFLSSKWDFKDRIVLMIQCSWEMECFISLLQPGIDF